MVNCLYCRYGGYSDILVRNKFTKWTKFPKSVHTFPSNTRSDSFVQVHILARYDALPDDIYLPTYCWIHCDPYGFAKARQKRRIYHYDWIIRSTHVYDSTLKKRDWAFFLHTKPAYYSDSIFYR